MRWRDDREDAVEASAEFPNPRVSYYWDAHRLSGKEWGSTLGLGQTAWDVYFLFGRGVQWGERAPIPSFWMHQLGDAADMAPFLDLDGLTAAVDSLLLL